MWPGPVCVRKACVHLCVCVCVCVPKLHETSPRYLRSCVVTSFHIHLSHIFTDLQLHGWLECHWLEMLPVSVPIHLFTPPARSVGTDGVWTKAPTSCPSRARPHQGVVLGLTFAVKHPAAGVGLLPRALFLGHPHQHSVLLHFESQSERKSSLQGWTPTHNKLHFWLWTLCWFHFELGWALGLRLHRNSLASPTGMYISPCWRSFQGRNVQTNEALLICFL